MRSAATQAQFIYKVAIEFLKEALVFFAKKYLPGGWWGEWRLSGCSCQNRLRGRRSQFAFTRSCHYFISVFGTNCRTYIQQGGVILLWVVDEALL